VKSAENPSIPDNGKEDSYERNPGGVSFVFNLSFSELFSGSEKLDSLSKTCFRQAVADGPWGRLPFPVPGAFASLTHPYIFAKLFIVLLYTIG
jgi:hypothetical protein